MIEIPPDPLFEGHISNRLYGLGLRIAKLRDYIAESVVDFKESETQYDPFFVSFRNVELHIPDPFPTPNERFSEITLTDLTGSVQTVLRTDGRGRQIQEEIKNHLWMKGSGQEYSEVMVHVRRSIFPSLNELELLYVHGTPRRRKREELDERIPDAVRDGGYS